MEESEFMPLPKQLANIRQKIFDILEIYLQRQTTAKEMMSVILTVHFCSMDWLVVGLLALLLRLFRTLHVQDPLVLLLYEHQFAGSLYTLLYSERPIECQLAVAELLATMAMSEAVPERYKQYMQLPATAWPWLISQLQDNALHNINLLNHFIKIMEMGKKRMRDGNLTYSLINK